MAEFHIICKVVPSAKKSLIKVLPEKETPFQFQKWKPRYFLKVYLHLPAKKGKANKELISLLAKRFSVKQTDIILVVGAKSRFKILKIKK